jgi:hypothetical protein
VDRSDRPGRRRARRALAAALACGAALAAARVGMGAGWFVAPYPAPGRALAWTLGEPAAAYNFGVVVPGRVYRSSKPDERFLRWLRDEYGIRRVIGLSGELPVHEAARRLGFEVATFRWRVSELAPWTELEAVVGLLDDGAPVLVHCASGSDRTGFAVAAFRVLRERWDLARAEREMARYGHDAAEQPRQHARLRELLRAVHGSGSAPPVVATSAERG